jgi:hypothetical protein
LLSSIKELALILGVFTEKPVEHKHMIEQVDEKNPIPNVVSVSVDGLAYRVDDD